MWKGRRGKSTRKKKPRKGGNTTLVEKAPCGHIYYFARFDVTIAYSKSGCKS